MSVDIDESEIDIDLIIPDIDVIESSDSIACLPMRFATAFLASGQTPTSVRRIRSIT